MLKKVIYSATCILFIFLFEASAQNNKMLISNAPAASSINKCLNIEKDQIKQIIISAFPVRFQPIRISDTNHIFIILDYFKSLKLENAHSDPSNFMGGGYSIEIQFKNGSKRVLSHCGNMFFIEKDKFIGKMRYEEAIKMDCIVASILECNFDKAKMPFFIGSIISIKPDSSGRKTFCEIKDNKNTFQNINISNASIIDSTGHGWLILHQDDKVKIYYDKNKSLEKNPFYVTNVFIKRTSK